MAITIWFCSLSVYHWCIKSIYNGFATAIHCTLKGVPFGFCFVQVMPIFKVKVKEELTKLGLQRLAAFLGFMHF